MTRLTTLLASFRGRFLIVVFGAAVVPLVLIGAWLTRSVVRAGEDLLGSELHQALDQIAVGVESRWSYRSGELALLTNNDVAHRLLAGGTAQALTGEDSQYLDQLLASLAGTIAAFEYRDASGRVRWASPAPFVDTDARSLTPAVDRIDARGASVVPSLTRPTMTIRRPMTESTGHAPIGELIARIDLSSLTAIDTAMRLPNGARLQWVERATGLSLLPSFAPDALLGQRRFTASAVEWLVARRSLVEPEIDLILAAPLGAYVQPFERVARRGAITLALVALLALGLSALLTARLTSSLEQLAIAADAVAKGDLAHKVNGRGAAEIARVAAAFNTMTESLKRTLAELSRGQALAAAGEFAASLSHEVRNALTAVRVDLQRAEEKAAGDAPDRPLIARALENVQRLDGTLSSALRAARHGERPRRRIDLGPVVAAAARSAESAFAEHGGRLALLTTSAPPVWVLGDPIALEQLFLNLLLNAAQAMGPGGRASIMFDIDGAEVRAIVIDSGHGISATNLEHVFEPFFTTKADGTGLGLPIARQMAVAHGGSLIIESVPGDGTRVEVRLPLAGAPAQNTAASTNQNVAMAFTGNPVPPMTGTGATVNRNSHRF